VAAPGSFAGNATGERAANAMSNRACIHCSDAADTFQVRTVAAEALAACPFSIAQEYAADYFRRAETGHAEAEIRVPIFFMTTILRRRVGLTFGIHSDSTEAGRTHDEIRVRWSTGTPLLPDFHGTVRLRIAGLGTRVLVDGGYHAPFGLFGRLFDWCIGAYIARTSVSDLSHRVATHLEGREQEWRARVTRPVRQ
jgi:hypothetical protein